MVMRVGVIGYGNRIKNICNQMAALNPDIHLLAIADPRHEALAKQFADGARSDVAFYPTAEAMLAVGQKKITHKKLTGTITLQSGEAEHLHFEDDRFDAAIVAFGARNFENLAQGLSEMRRVLRPNGRIVVLEFSKPTLFPFKQLYFFYFRFVLPLIGSIVSKHSEAYHYLPDTVMQFPDGENFLAVLRSCGFTSVTRRSMTFGVATIYTGVK